MGLGYLGQIIPNVISSLVGYEEFDSKIIHNKDNSLINRLDQTPPSLKFCSLESYLAPRSHNSVIKAVIIPKFSNVMDDLEISKTLQ